MASIFGAISVETPKYNLIKRLAARIEIRHYERQIRAEVEVPSQGSLLDGLNQPFGMLAGYIFGGNTKRVAGEQSAQSSASEKVAMTSPVLMTQKQGGGSSGSAGNEKVAMTSPVLMTQQQSQATQTTVKKMTFIMPSKYTSVESLPVPKDARVNIVEVPDYKVAVITFNGSFSGSNKAFKEKEAELRQSAKSAGVVLSDKPEQVVLAGYNPPWCLPWMRTNEIMIPCIEE